MENKKYIVYIDESNILAKTGNSVYVAIYINYLDKDEVGRNIINVEYSLSISYLHWVDMPWKLRKKFAEKIKILDFVCKTIVYNNPVNAENVFKDFLFKIISDSNHLIKIIIDGKKSKRYEHKLKSILKDRGFKFIRIVFTDDKKEPLIRLADFMAGLYRSFIDNKNADNTHIYNLLKNKIKTPD